MRQSKFKILAMLSEQRKPKGDCRGRRRQVDTKRYVAAAHQSPVQRGPDVYHRLTPHPLVIVNAIGRAAQVQKSQRMAPAECLELASFAKFIVRVDLSGLKQSIGDSMATYIGSDHRLGNEIGESFQNRWFRQFVITDHFDGVIDAEVSRENAETPKAD